MLTIQTTPPIYDQSVIKPVTIAEIFSRIDHRPSLFAEQSSLRSHVVTTSSNRRCGPAAGVIRPHPTLRASARWLGGWGGPRRPWPEIADCLAKGRFVLYTG